MSGNRHYKGLAPFPPKFDGDYPPIARVVVDACIACDRCTPVCFFDALVMEPTDKNKFERTARVVSDNCTGCGLCFETCPVDAIVWIADIDQ